MRWPDLSRAVHLRSHPLQLVEDLAVAWGCSAGI